MKLLYVEDETQIAEPLIKALEKQKYLVDYAEDGEQGLFLAKTNEYDCIVLDLNLPKIDGLEISREIRADKIFTPILMLTARTTSRNIIEGFEAGTDDYLTKPFHFAELKLRIEALIRRSSYNKSADLSVSDLSIDTERKVVIKAGNEIALNAKEYGILEYLMRNKGKPISQETLLEHVWDQNIDVFTQTVRTNIKTLRKKVDPDKNIIETIVGQGYVIKNK